MDNKKRLIDADTFIEALEYEDADVCEQNGYGAIWGFSKRSIIDLIQNIQTVDAVEVVHCKDCKHLENGCRCYYPLGVILANDDWLLVYGDDDFCSYGERKD